MPKRFMQVSPKACFTVQLCLNLIISLSVDSGPFYIYVEDTAVYGFTFKILVDQNLAIVLSSVLLLTVQGWGEMACRI